VICADFEKSLQKLPLLLFSAEGAVHRYCEPPKTKRLITSIKADNSKSAQKNKHLHYTIKIPRGKYGDLCGFFNDI